MHTDANNNHQVLHELKRLRRTNELGLVLFLFVIAGAAAAIFLPISSKPRKQPARPRASRNRSLRQARPS